MWFGAFLTILALITLFWKFGSTFRQLILGYDIIVDVVVTALFVWLFASTGTISGMMIAIAAGLLVSVMLLIAKKLGTSRTLKATRHGHFRLTWQHQVHHGLIHRLRRTI